MRSENSVNAADDVELDISLDDPAGAVVAAADDAPAPRGGPSLEAIKLMISHEMQLAEASQRTTIDHAITVGELLIQAKEQVGHGKFMAWITENVKCSHDTARNCMRLALHKELILNSERVRNMSLRAAIKYLADPGERKAVDGPKVQVIPAAAAPEGQQIRVKGYGAGQELRRLERTGEDDGATGPEPEEGEERGGGLEAYEGFRPPEGVEPGRLTVAPNLPITDRDEGQPTGGGMRREQDSRREADPRREANPQHEALPLPPVSQATDPQSTMNRWSAQTRDALRWLPDHYARGMARMLAQVWELRGIKIKIDIEG